MIFQKIFGVDPWFLEENIRKELGIILRHFDKYLEFSKKKQITFEAVKKDFIIERRSGFLLSTFESTKNLNKIIPTLRNRLRVAQKQAQYHTKSLKKADEIRAILNVISKLNDFRDTINDIKSIIKYESELINHIPNSVAKRSEVAEKLSQLLSEEADILNENDSIRTQISDNISNAAAKIRPELYARIVSKEEKNVLERTRLLLGRAGQLIPTISIASDSVKNILLSLSKKELGELYKQMGGKGDWREIIFFRAAEKPVQESKFRHVDWLKQFFFKPGAEIQIL